VLVDDLVTRESLSPYPSLHQPGRVPPPAFRQDQLRTLRLTEQGRDPRPCWRASVCQAHTRRERPTALDELKDLLPPPTPHDGLRIAAWLKEAGKTTWPVPTPKSCVRKFQQPNFGDVAQNDIKYAGYIIPPEPSRWRKSARPWRTAPFPEWLDYQALTGLKREAQIKLTQIPPGHLRPSPPVSKGSRRPGPGRCLRSRGAGGSSLN